MATKPTTKPQDNPKRYRVSLDVEPTLWRRVRALAASEGQTVKEFLGALLRSAVGLGSSSSDGRKS